MPAITDFGGVITPAGESATVETTLSADATIFSAAVNANGALIRFVSLFVTSGAATFARLTFGPVTPNITIVLVEGGNFVVERDLFIPPGHALGFFRTGAATYSYAINYRLF